MDEIIEVVVAFRVLQSAKAAVGRAEAELNRRLGAKNAADVEFCSMLVGLSESELHELNDRLDIEFGGVFSSD